MATEKLKRATQGRDAANWTVEQPVIKFSNGQNFLSQSQF